MATATAKKPGRKPKPLTPREKRLLAILPEAKTLKEALLTAGYSESTANSNADRTITRVVGKSGIVDALEKQGIDMDFLAQKHLEGLEAYKVISATVIHKSGKNKEADSQTNDFIEVPDFPARHKHLDTIHKLRGDFTEKVEITGDGGFANILAEALNRAKEAKGGK
jgi:hypothetical protein